MLTQVQLYYKNEMSVTDHIVLNGNALIPHKNIRTSIKIGPTITLKYSLKKFKIIIFLLIFQNYNYETINPLT